MSDLHLRPVQFVDTPIGRDGEVARLAGGMQWFAAYEVIEGGASRVMPIAEFERSLGANDERAAARHATITAPRPPLTSRPAPCPPVPPASSAPTAIRFELLIPD